MGTTQTATADDRTVNRPDSPWRRVRLWAGAHAIDDLYQGLIPAVVPYFVLQRHFSYVEASGLVLAATLGSALPPLAVGFLADRHRLPWLAPLGISQSCSPRSPASRSSAPSCPTVSPRSSRSTGYGIWGPLPPWAALRSRSKWAAVCSARSPGGASARVPAS